MFENNPNYDFDDASIQDIQLNSTTAINVTPTKHSVESVRFQPFKKPAPIKKIAEKSPKNVVTRKFPGPAGLLPDRKDLTSTPFWDNANSKTRRDDVIPCSQTSVSAFQEAAWQEMNKEFKFLLAKYNIAWIKTNANLHKLTTQKAPFLSAVIRNIECLDERNPIVNVVLKDLTGEIQGTIIHNLYEEYSDSLVAGSVIVLKQFAVLTTAANKHYLTITPRNLVAVYHRNKDEEIVVSRLQVMSGEFSLKQAETKETNGEVSVGGSALWEDALEGIDADSFFEDS